jgi:hypothetical protein
MPETIPDECQLCRVNDRRGEEINAPEVSVQVARDDGGTKFVYCCRPCLDETFEATVDAPTVSLLE